MTDATPMTPEQRTELEALCRNAGEPMADGLSQAEARQRIAELRARVARAPTPSDGEADAPPDEGPLKSLGRAVGDTVLGTEPPIAGTEQPSRH
jgi:hypothetical protein